MVSLVAGEAGAAVNRAKVQDWRPTEPPRSAAGLSAWADGLISYLQARSCFLVLVSWPAGVW